MANVHIPRVRGTFGGVAIPKTLFNGTESGLGVFTSKDHPDPAAVARDVLRLSKSHDVALAGRVDLPAGTLIAIEMPDNPGKLFQQLGLSKSEVQNQLNVVNIGDPKETDIMARWQGFMQTNKRALDSATDDEIEAFEMRSADIGVNSKNALVIETPFGRSFVDGNVTHSEWQRASDGLPKGKGGRGSLFYRGHTNEDWAYLARTLIAQLHQYPDRPISTTDLNTMLAVGHVEGGPKIDIDRFRELIEGEAALVRAQRVVEGRPFAETLSIGFPPHNPADRSGRRVTFAQFSTPPAVGEVAAEFLKPNGKTVYEPTIGNGVFVAPSYAQGGLVYGVEIDANRHERAANALPQARVALGDATDKELAVSADPALDRDGRFDTVLANPPYGKGEETVQKVKLDAFGFEMSARKLETAIAADAISKLNEGGSAVLVMPAQMMRPSEPTEESRKFQTMLNIVFDRVDTVALDSSLYRGMGSNFPVLVHFCEDRLSKENARSLPDAADRVPKEIEVLGTFGAFYDRASEIIENSNIQALDDGLAEERRNVFLGSNDPIFEADAVVDDELEEEVPTAPVSEREPSEDRTPGGLSGGGGGAAPQASTSPSAPVEEEPEEVLERPTAGEANDLAAPTLREWFIDDFSPDEFTVPYTPKSRKGSTLAVIERTMADETYRALARVEEALGKTVDEYVAERMGIPYEDFMSETTLFFPEQVDSLALSFFRQEQQRATIIGDQMGVGKGIQLAAHAYASVAVEDRPTLFASNRANLFSDLCIRDWKNASNNRFLDMVKDGAIRPFIVNNEPLRENGKVVLSTSAQDRKAAKDQKSFGDSNFVMMTYSQVQTASGHWRHQAVKDWITRNAEDGKPPRLLLDEVHKAAGEDSRTGRIVQDIIAHAERHGADIVYSSATSLKSGRNLPVYTPALPETGLSTSELLLSIEKMPLAMQEVLAAEMAKDGALIERKMPDAGVDRDLVHLADVDNGKMDSTREMTDRMSALLRDLAEKQPEIAKAAKDQFRRHLAGTAAAGSLDKVRVETTSVASQLDSFSRYMMGAVKGRFISELVQEAAGRGNKPSVVSEYTADSISEYVIGDQLPFIASPEGVPVAGHPNIGDVLKRFADNSLNMKGADGLGNLVTLRVQGFDDWLEDYMADVDAAKVEDLRVNVFDRAREAAEAIGMTFEDITGRKYEFRENEQGEVRAFLRDIPVTGDAVDRYNRGKTDVLALNSGSATGVSIQASPAHGKDVRRREMIKLAFQREITDERQVEGRVHRAGQIVPPRYTIPVTGFAPDDRIANLFNRANRSLTSSTSATRENKTNVSHAVDILNPIGERAAIQVLKGNPEIAHMLQIVPDKTQDVARKLLGRSVMLPLAEQSAVLSEVDATFRVISDRMTAEGTNPLRLAHYDWGAQVNEVEELVPGVPGATSMAAQPLRLNRVTFKEEIATLSANAVAENIKDYTHRRKQPFENMHTAFGFPDASHRGQADFEHHLFAGATGRRQENERFLWPSPVPGDLARLMVYDMRRQLREYDGNSETLRDVSEALAQSLLKNPHRIGGFADYRRTVEERAKDGKSPLTETSVAVGLRALWNRHERFERLDRALPLIEPGKLIAIDARALNSVQGGMWGEAYGKTDFKNGLVPAIVMSANDVESPFAESKISFSVFVPGSEFTERLTLSHLRNGMEFEGARGEDPLRPISTFYSQVVSRDSPTQTAMRTFISDERMERLVGQLEEHRWTAGGHFDGLDRVVGGGREIDEFGFGAFRALTEAVPNDIRIHNRLTLEGNLFIGMTAVSSSVGNTTVGEKVVYSDENGSQRNAILLNDKSGKSLLNGVKAKLEKRSAVHTGLNTASDIGDYLRVTNAIQHGLGYMDETGARETLDALSRFYPDVFREEEHAGKSSEDLNVIFAERLAEIRVNMFSAERTFPPSVMSGGDIWRYASDLEQKANAASRDNKPRGHYPGMGYPANMMVSVSKEDNVLGYRDTNVKTSLNPSAVAAGLAKVDASQAIAISLRQGEVTLVLHKDHPSLKENPELLDRTNQKLWDAKLRSGILAADMDLTNPADRQLVGEALTRTAGKPEVLIGGAMKVIQEGMAKTADDRKRAVLSAQLAVEKAASPSPNSAEQRRDKTRDNGGSYGAAP